MHLFISFILLSLLFPVQLSQAFSSPFNSLPALRKLERPQNKHVPRVLASAAPYPEHNFTVPVDHFHNETRYEPHTDDRFGLRYWFDARHYRDGGPVFVIAAGETDATARFPFLSQGIVAQLAEKYRGVGVIIEHRYYGKSYPGGDLTTESIRFLSTDQAIADYAYFASHVVFPGLERFNLTASHTPWIAYGGSYAGAFVALLRKLYPDVFWGAISSSGVTTAIDDYWQYFEPIRQYGPSDCVIAQQTFVDIVDKVLIEQEHNETMKRQLFSAFGLNATMASVDFVSMLTTPLELFQNRNWDPAVGTDDFRLYCANITSSKLLYPDTAAFTDSVKEIIHAAGYDENNSSLVTNVLNYAGYCNARVFSSLLSSNKDNDHAAATSASAARLPRRSLSRSSEVSWNYQVCTEWGYFMTGASVPSGIMPLISRLIDLHYTSAVCAADFDIDTRPNTTIINRHGGFNFSYSRVAIIDGLADPWRPATPHADMAPARLSTDEEPFLLLDIPAADVWDGIRGAVHHWDQNGLVNEQLGTGKVLPKAIVFIHQEVLRFVWVWLQQWNTSHMQRNDRTGRQQMLHLRG